VRDRKIEEISVQLEVERKRAEEAEEKAKELQSEHDTAVEAVNKLKVIFLYIISILQIMFFLYSSNSRVNRNFQKYC
jgi:hypothetical protein